jgi:hypothetical protein
MQSNHLAFTHTEERRGRKEEPIVQGTEKQSRMNPEVRLDSDREEGKS